MEFFVGLEGRSNEKMKFFVGLEGRSNEKNMFRSRFAYFAAKIFFRSRIFFYICFIIIFKENRHEEFKKPDNRLSRDKSC